MNNKTENNLVDADLNEVEINLTNSFNNLNISSVQLDIDPLNNLTSSKNQTKQWRQSQLWYSNGKHNECETYQLKMIEHIINSKCEKTNDRLHMESYDIISIKNPMKNIDGFEYTEDFDGKIFKNNKIKYQYIN